jgi:acetyl esterase/lipase
MIHGGFWRAKYDLSHASHLCAALADAGLAVANLEYRRVGEPGGGWPGSFEDVLRGIVAVRQFFGTPPVVLGHSSGGHLALRIASERLEIKGVVALAPVADLRIAYELTLSNGAVAEFLGADPRESPKIMEAACASKHVAKVSVILIHGTADNDVPIELSRSYSEARKNDDSHIELVEISLANHFDLIDPESEAWPTVRDCVLNLAKR